MSFYLRHIGFDFPLRPGSTIVGRAVDCQVVLLSHRVSRHHAVLTLTESRLTVQDLNSANGVFVNGQRTTKITTLDPDDELELASESLRVIWAGDRSGVVPRVKDVAVTSGSSHFVSILGNLADRAFGRQSAREQVLHPHLRDVLSQARATERLPSGVAEEAARQAVRLAEAEKDPAWIEYIFELHIALRRPLTRDVIERLQALIRNMPPIQLEPLRRYIRVLRASAKRFAPGQRFLVRRIMDLESLAFDRHLDAMNLPNLGLKTAERH